jgi:hypothetical protein
VRSRYCSVSDVLETLTSILSQRERQKSSLAQRTAISRSGKIGGAPSPLFSP